MRVMGIISRVTHGSYILHARQAPCYETSVSDVPLRSSHSSICQIAPKGYCSMPSAAHTFYQYFGLDAARLATNAEADTTTIRKLEALRPTPLVPCQVAKRGLSAVSTLKQIDAIKVRKTARHPTDQATYCIDMYCRDKQSRIPVRRQYGTVRERTRGAPSVTLQVGITDFLRLAHDAYELTYHSHIVASCAFCREMIFYNTTSDIKPRRKMHWFKSDRDVCAMLTTYLNAMLHHVVQLPTCGNNVCPGQNRVSQLLQRFLRSPECVRDSI
jgi:hypothetical protein